MQINLQTQFMEVHGETNDGWTRFEAPSSVDNGVFVGNDQIFFSNARGEVFLSDFEHGLATLKVRSALPNDSVFVKQVLGGRFKPLLYKQVWKHFQLIDLSCWPQVLGETLRCVASIISK